MNNRDLDYALYSAIYNKVVGPDGPYVCSYCGLTASQLDHIPAISRVQDYLDIYYLEAPVFIKMPCCRRCNVVLSNSLQIDFIERLEVLRDRLCSRSRLFKGGHWTEERIVDGEYEGGLYGELVKLSRKQKRFKDEIEYNGGLKAYLNYLVENY